MFIEGLQMDQLSKSRQIQPVKYCQQNLKLFLKRVNNNFWKIFQALVIGRWKHKQLI